MMDLGTATGPGKSRRRKDDVRPLTLLVRLMHDLGREAAPSTVYAEFLARLRIEDYDDLQLGVNREWLALKFNDAHRIAFPPSDEELEARRAAREAERKAAKVLILLDLRMPNGKLLRECTGRECVELGGRYVKLGKRVGAKKLVGEVLTEAQVRAVLGP